MDTEDLTRKTIIDVLLREQGWEVSDASRVRVEIDTKQSDFKNAIYKEKSETLEKPGEHKYLDYLLLDSFGKPLAVIEAKKSSKDWLLGKKQALEYAEDIEKQTGEKIFIYLTNGKEVQFWNHAFEPLRKVATFHTQQDLERMIFQNMNRVIKFHTIPINTEIIDRPYQNQAVSQVLQRFEKGFRKSLVVMATGTGKTRVAMAMIDVLLKSNRVQRILFLTDRTVLRDQAYVKGFQKFFPSETKAKIYSKDVNHDARLYAANIQTMIECYQDFSPGFFDVIISDEAHRSIYNKWRDIFTYFDSLQIGLTATPSEEIDRDTFRFFQCDDNAPATNYSYDEAINSKPPYLVPFRVYKARTHFQLKGIRPKDIPKEVKEQLADKGVSEDELDFEGTDIEKKVTNKGTTESLVREFMENCYVDKTGTLPAKTIFFAVSKAHARRLRQAFDDLYPEYNSHLADVIVSDDSRALDLKHAFEHESLPRVAISVDMLDTGVDIPEVCNLVFAKPVFSKIKFWQMIGRGTRTEEACEHTEWLPEGGKKDFLIIDHWDNFEWHKLNPKGVETSTSEAQPVKIFRMRIDEAEYFYKKGDETHFNQLVELINADIKFLPRKNVSIREFSDEIDTAIDSKFWNSVGIKPFEFLRKKIAPLMRFKEDVNYQESSFLMKTERLANALLFRNDNEVERLKNDFGETMLRLPMSINQVRSKKKLIDKVRSKDFWKSVSYEDARIMQNELTEIMRYLRAEPAQVVELDLQDTVEERDWDNEPFSYGPEGQMQDYVKNYRSKVESQVKELAEKHPTIKKIKANKTITKEDIDALEKTLNSPELYVTEETLKRLYQKSEGTLVQFVKKIIGLYEFPEPEELIKKAFEGYIEEHSELNPVQKKFVTVLKNYFITNRHMEFSDFFKKPFTNFGPRAPLSVFNENQLQELATVCISLERKVYKDAN